MILFSIKTLFLNICYIFFKKKLNLHFNYYYDDYFNFIFIKIIKLIYHIIILNDDHVRNMCVETSVYINTIELG